MAFDTAAQSQAAIGMGIPGGFGPPWSTDASIGLDEAAVVLATYPVTGAVSGPIAAAAGERRLARYFFGWANRWGWM